MIEWILNALPWWIGMAIGFGYARLIDRVEARAKRKKLAAHAAMPRPKLQHFCHDWIVGIPLHGSPMGTKVRTDVCRECLAERELINAGDGHGWRLDPRKVVAELKTKREEPKP